MQLSVVSVKWGAWTSWSQRPLPALTFQDSKYVSSVITWRENWIGRWIRLMCEKHPGGYGHSQITAIDSPFWTQMSNREGSVWVVWNKHRQLDHHAKEWAGEGVQTASRRQADRKMISAFGFYKPGKISPLQSHGCSQDSCHWQGVGRGGGAVLKRFSEVCQVILFGQLIPTFLWDSA